MIAVVGMVAYYERRHYHLIERIQRLEMWMKMHNGVLAQDDKEERD